MDLFIQESSKYQHTNIHRQTHILYTETYAYTYLTDIPTHICIHAYMYKNLHTHQHILVYTLC